MSHPDPELLTLAALPAEPRDTKIEKHLIGCAVCREHVAALRRTVDLARTGHADSATPPPRVWQAIADEVSAGGSGAVGTGSDIAPIATELPDVAPIERRVRRAWSRRRVAGLSIAAAAAGLAAGLVIGIALPVDRQPAPPSGALLARLQPIGAADPAATGTVDGVAHDGSQELVIRVDGVTDAVGGDYLEAWLIDPANSRLVSLGPLTRTPDGRAYQGDFTVPGNLPMSAFNTVDISAERWDGDPEHSGISLLRGSMA